METKEQKEKRYNTLRIRVTELNLELGKLEEEIHLLDLDEEGDK